MEPGDDAGPAGGQHLVAALQVGPAEVVGVEGAQLQVGAQRPVEDEDPLGQRREEPGGHQAALRGAACASGRSSRVKISFVARAPLRV